MRKPMICFYTGITLFFFSCSTTTSRQFSSVPRQLVPAQEKRVWKDGQVQQVDTSGNVYAAVKDARQYQWKNVFTIRIENRSANSVEFDPEKFYTLNKLSNGERMSVYAFPATYMVAVQKPPLRTIRSTGDIGLLLAPFWILGTISEIEQLVMMGPEERRAYEMQAALERIAENQRREQEEKRRAIEYQKQFTSVEAYSRSLLRKHTLKPGETIDGEVAFPVVSGIDSLWLLVPLSTSDTLKFRYGLMP